MMMSIPLGNRLKEIREREGIPIPDLARASRVGERILRRVEEADGAPRLEVKVRLVAGLNSLLDGQRYRTEDIFADWKPHRRDAKKT
jgi:transcriptional regulator with XRE-family HTH domain